MRLIIWSALDSVSWNGVTGLSAVKDKNSSFFMAVSVMAP